jgi:hypothetical protein
MSRGSLTIGVKSTCSSSGIGQCTQALKDKLKEDVDWQAISDGYDSVWLMALIENYILKQTESHYPYLAVQEESRSMLNFAQGDDMTIGAYYEKFTTRKAIFERAGCSFVTQYLLDTEAVLLYPGRSYDIIIIIIRDGDMML